MLIINNLLLSLSKFDLSLNKSMLDKINKRNTILKRSNDNTNNK